MLLTVYNLVDERLIRRFLVMTSRPPEQKAQNSYLGKNVVPATIDIDENLLGATKRASSWMLASWPRLLVTPDRP
jgi:hypothetical protein